MLPSYFTIPDLGTKCAVGDNVVDFHVEVRVIDDAWEQTAMNYPKSAGLYWVKLGICMKEDKYNGIATVMGKAPFLYVFHIHCFIGSPFAVELAEEPVEDYLSFISSISAWGPEVEIPSA